MNSISFTINNFLFRIDRPVLFCILIPALLLGIIPFLRINKKRRASIKHVVPFIIHLSLIFVLSTLLAGITVTEHTNERFSTKVCFVVDVSDSNAPMKTQMNNLIKSVIQESDLEKDEFGIVLFGNGIIEKKFGNHEIDLDATDFLKYEKDPDDKTDGTDIGSAISAAATWLNEKEETSMFETTSKRKNKKMIVLSDGLENLGDSANVAEFLGSEIQINGAYFNLLDEKYDNREVQLMTVNTSGVVPEGGNVKVEVVINSAKFTRKALIKIEEGEKEVASKYVDLQPGENIVRLEYTPETAGVNVIRASVNTDERNDLLSVNNTLYSWYELEPQKKILVVDGDADSESVGQYEQIKKSDVVNKIAGYAVNVVGIREFPKNLEALLEYDQVVLMDVNFDELAKAAPTAATDLQRYVEEVGRGLFCSFGDNFYDITGEVTEDNSGESYREIPFESMLPVQLELEGEKETVAMVLVVDLSSSMKVLMLGATEEEKEKGEGFEDTDYIGVICFDSGVHVALEMKELGDLESREEICKDIEYELRHYYYWYYLNPDGKTESDIPIGRDDGDKYINMGYVKPSNFSTSGGLDKQTQQYIRSYGTSYKWPIQAASDMLDDKNDEVMLHIKQVLFMSDGAPNDAGSYLGIVERMESGGITTSTIAAGLDTKSVSNQESQKKELMKIANAGGGDFYVAETADDLTEKIITKAEEVAATLVNERSVLPMENSYNSSVMQGIFADEDENKLDKIGGYYTAKIKEGADMILYVDKMKPLYAEWQFGLGKVAVFMSDLGNEKWTGSLFGSGNGLTFVTNMLNATMNSQASSTGLEYTVSRDGTDVSLMVNTPVRLREEKNEELVLITYNREMGQMGDEIVLSKMAEKKYSAKVTMDTSDETYIMLVQLRNSRTNVVNDSIAFVINGEYNPEYNVFTAGGESTMAGIASNGNGDVIVSGEGLFDDITNQNITLHHDVTTPAIMAVLVLFLLDILFRNIVVRRKKDEQPVMTEEERIESMRGR